MCGIAGVAATRNNIDLDKLNNMCDVLAHRGPDGFGSWITNNGKIGLSHRRLAIQDLSEAGSQPMHSVSGRYSITFNGEIYNFKILRKYLETHGAHFLGNSDTEVLLAAFEYWGVTETLSQISGMFTFAIWDAYERKLYLARDRIGIKPLYYRHCDGELSFASELRPIIKWNGKLLPISDRGLLEYLRLGYVPCPLSIFEGIWKLPPGTYIIWKSGQLSKPKEYWSLTETVETGLENPINNEKKALLELECALEESISQHMTSDVPLGAFLSGGIDSSTVVALMQAQRSTSINTFSIGFSDSNFNEAQHAHKVASHLSTNHTELYITDNDAKSVIPSLAQVYDEPFADTSQIPTILISQLARSKVKVVLTGDGGDELFAGYNRYLFVSNFWHKLQLIPSSVRNLASSAISYPTVASWDKFFDIIRPILPKLFLPSLPGQKMHKIGSILPSSSLLEIHTKLVSQWSTPQLALRVENKNLDGIWQELLSEQSHISPALQQSLWDSQTYLIDDILTKVDRASMRFGLEARVPLLDHNVIKTAWRIPEKMKFRDGQGKWILKELLYRHVPKSILDRPKMGFGVPIDEWLRSGLRDWAETYLDEQRLKEEGYLNVAIIRQTWTNHKNNLGNHGGALWTVLMFQQWLEGSRNWV